MVKRRVPAVTLEEMAEFLLGEFNRWAKIYQDPAVSDKTRNDSGMRAAVLAEQLFFLYRKKVLSLSVRAEFNAFFEALLIEARTA